MGLAAIIAIAVGVQYVNDLATASFTIKPLIGGGIVLLILSAVDDGLSSTLAYTLAWLVLLAVLLNGHAAVGNFLANVGDA